MHGVNRYLLMKEKNNFSSNSNERAAEFNEDLKLLLINEEIENEKIF